MDYSDVATEVERVSIRLKVEIEAAHHNLGEISRTLGKQDGYLARALKAPKKLEMGTVFEALAEIGLHPADFFLRIRPFEEGGYLTDMKTLMEAASARPLNIDPEGKWTGASEVPRLCQQLRRVTHEAGKTIREVSEALGYEPDSLSRILRGNGALKVWQVYAALRYVGVPHEDFFDGMYGLVGGAPNLMLPGGYMWSELRDLIRRLNEQLDGAERGSRREGGSGLPFRGEDRRKGNDC